MPCPVAHPATAPDAIGEDSDRPLVRVWAAVGFILLCIGVLTAADRRLLARLEAAPPLADLVYAPPARFLEAVSLGYDHALADALWFRTINYFGKHYRDDRVYPWLGHMCDRVTDLDPGASYVYRFAGLILPWEAERVDEGIHLLRKGARNLPDAWEPSYMLGFSLYFFKDDLPGASAALRRAAMAPSAPHFVGELLAVIESAHSGPENAESFLLTLERGAELPEVRSALRRRILDLRFAGDLVSLQSAVSRFRTAQGRFPTDPLELLLAGHLPYLPPEPWGSRFEVSPETGEVTSANGRQPLRLGSSQVRESLRSGVTRERK